MSSRPMQHLWKLRQVTLKPRYTCNVDRSTERLLLELESSPWRSTIMSHAAAACTPGLVNVFVVDQGNANCSMNVPS